MDVLQKTELSEFEKELTVGEITSYEIRLRQTNCECAHDLRVLLRLNLCVQFPFKAAAAAAMSMQL